MKDFKKILKEIGNNPLEEPEISEIANSESETKRSDILKIALKRIDKKLKDYNKNDLNRVYHAIIIKVRDFKDEDGVYKSTPLTENLEPLSFEDDEKLASIMQKLSSVDLTEDGEIEKFNKEVKSFLFGKNGVCNLDNDKLSDWEKLLVSEQLVKEVIDMNSLALGKPLDG